MSTHKKWIGASLAAAVAVAFVAVPYTSTLANKSELVICPGVNSCKGRGDCMTMSTQCGHFNKCRGENSCKGKGFLMLSKAECVKRGSHGIEYVGSSSGAVMEPPAEIDQPLE